MRLISAPYASSARMHCRSSDSPSTHHIKGLRPCSSLRFRLHRLPAAKKRTTSLLPVYRASPRFTTAAASSMRNNSVPAAQAVKRGVRPKLLGVSIREILRLPCPGLDAALCAGTRYDPCGQCARLCRLKPILSRQAGEAASKPSVPDERGSAGRACCLQVQRHLQADSPLHS